MTAAMSTWEMKKLLPWHKQLCSMLAQGIDRQTIAQVFQKTPEYISMLSGQTLIQEEVSAMKKFAEFQLEAQFVRSVSVIGEVLENGSPKEKIQAARLQLEATRRIGPRMAEEEKLIDTNARLTRLAERLLYLQGKGTQRVEVKEAEWSEVPATQPTESLITPEVSSDTTGSEEL